LTTKLKMAYTCSQMCRENISEKEKPKSKKQKEPTPDSRPIPLMKDSIKMGTFQSLPATGDRPETFELQTTSTWMNFKVSKNEGATQRYINDLNRMAEKKQASRPVSTRTASRTKNAHKHIRRKDLIAQLGGDHRSDLGRPLWRDSTSGIFVDYIPILIMMPIIVSLDSKPFNQSFETKAQPIPLDGSGKTCGGMRYGFHWDQNYRKFQEVNYIPDNQEEELEPGHGEADKSKWQIEHYRQHDMKWYHANVINATYSTAAYGELAERIWRFIGDNLTNLSPEEVKEKMVDFDVFIAVEQQGEQHHQDLHVTNQNSLHKAEQLLNREKNDDGSLVTDLDIGFEF
jgi:hypothetical protein